MRLTLIALSFFIFASCRTCRVTSVEDCFRYQEKGYQARVAVYPVGMDGLLWGSFIWSRHAQGQVLINGQWRWIGLTGPTDRSTFSIQGDIVYLDPQEYKARLEEQDLFN